MNSNTKKNLFKALTIIVLVFCSLVVVYPIIYVVSAAFSENLYFDATEVVPFATGFSFSRFEYLLAETNFGYWIVNTLIVAVSTSLVTVVTCALAAYVFSRFKFAFKKGMMMAMLILQIFPSFLGMRAIYVIIFRIGGLNQLWGLVLVYVAGNIPYNTWLVKSYLDTIPKSLDEAARIDGANHIKIFFRVILPMAKPIMIFLAITSFTGPWMDWLFPRLVLQEDEKLTLGTGLVKFLNAQYPGASFTTFAAGALLVAVPFTIFFVVSQKTMTTGLGAGAVKE